ncbi:S-formylglutathione hydrolase FrmB [Nocardioides alpinus]|uniref:Esterase n=1 Tax=Nocardioides alpinus TaxID=748909 RepID=A0A1I0Y930_9ACTN|nr:alpha/beta hydrolase family protein [Nocardioides alpinus]PKH39084.1 esterase [Nocardioides alpinus]SFB09307.1 S-formylglutathione hydrolase FrmB [Nocardioides alpinus]
MALLTCDLFSETLQRGTSMTVVLPQPTTEQIGVSGAVPDGPARVLYLLHGLSDDHTAWLRYTSIERYAAARGFAVVMPAVDRSFYANEAHGHAYWDFVSEELPQVVRRFLNVSHDPADTFVAGLSMGGYGALKHAVTFPERFAGVASLSGVTDILQLGARLERSEIVERVFDGTFGPQDDLFGLLEAVDPATAPRLYIGCGTGEDRLLPPNERFAEVARARGLDVTTDFRPGVHEWGLWDAQVQDVLDWMLG